MKHQRPDGRTQKDEIDGNDKKTTKVMSPGMWIKEGVGQFGINLGLL